MIEKDPNLYDQLTDFIIKIIIPSFIAVSIKIATQMRREKMTFFRIIMSYVVGIGCAYFTYPFVKIEMQTQYVPIIVAMVSISGEKVAEFLIYKWNIDDLLLAIANALKDFILNILTGKK